MRNTRARREQLYEFMAAPIADLRRNLAVVACRWEGTLSRLKAFVDG